MPNNWSAGIANLPRLPITFQAMEELPEYSCTVPTGVAVGKMWRRLDGSFDQDFLSAGGNPIWLIGRYEEAPAQFDQRKNKMVEMCKTVFYRPIIRVKMGKT